MTSERIPAVEVYRGNRIHAWQSRERIEEVVKPSIDAVLKMANAVQLCDYAQDTSNPPEARLAAADRCEAIWIMAAEGRAIRPPIDLTRMRAFMAGVDSLRWMHPFRFTSMFDRSGSAALRDEPLPERMDSLAEDSTL